MKMLEQLRNKNDEEKMKIIDQSFKPSKEAKSVNGEVLTPWWMVEEMLNTVDVDFWKQPHKVYDPVVGKGIFVFGVIKKFLEHLECDFDGHGFASDQDKRTFIIEELIYMCDINEENVELCKVLFGENCNIKCGDSLEIGWNVDFSLVVMNPPYNKNQGNQRVTTLYHKFVERFIDQARYMLCITPSRWFCAGKGLSSFRSMMLNRTDIKLIEHFDNSKDVFENVDIKGGVSYFLIDDEYKGGCKFNSENIILNKYDILVENKYHELIDHLNQFYSLEDLYRGRYYGIESNDKRLEDEKIGDNYLKCYTSQQKGFVKWIHRKYIDSCKLGKWKVITATAAGRGSDGFGNIFIGGPDEVHTGSYISFEVNNKKEAGVLLTYLKSKLANFMLSLRKISQAMNGNTIRWIPLPLLDQEYYDDQDVYETFDLTDDMIELIESECII